MDSLIPKGCKIVNNKQFDKLNDFFLFVVCHSHECIAHLCKCNVGLWLPSTFLIEVGCKEYKNGFNLTQCWTQILLSKWGSKNHPTLVSFTVCSVIGWNLHEDLCIPRALTVLGQNSSPNQFPAYVQRWAFLPEQPSGHNQRAVVIAFHFPWSMKDEWVDCNSQFNISQSINWSYTLRTQSYW
jgi:hypothetical protein